MNKKRVSLFKRICASALLVLMILPFMFMTVTAGNIGTPLLPLIDQMQESDYAVVELSSFQLMDMAHSPRIAVITNLAPNHLDIHKDMEEYV